MVKKKDGFNSTDDFNRRMNQATLSGKKKSNRPRKQINLSAVITPVLGIVLGYIVWIALVLTGIVPTGTMPSWLPFSKQVNAMVPFESVVNNSDNAWQQNDIIETNTPAIKMSITPSLTLSPTITLTPTVTQTPTVTLTPTPLINLSEPTILCNDGKYRTVEYQQGACSLHGGIKEVLQPIPVLPPSE